MENAAGVGQSLTFWPQCVFEWTAAVDSQVWLDVVSAEPLASSPPAEPQLSPQASRPSSPQTPASPAQLPSAVPASPPPAEPLGGSRPASPQDPPAATANGKETPNLLNLENVSCSMFKREDVLSSILSPPRSRSLVSGPAHRQPCTNPSVCWPGFAPQSVPSHPAAAGVAPAGGSPAHVAAHHPEPGPDRGHVPRPTAVWDQVLQSLWELVPPEPAPASGSVQTSPTRGSWRLCELMLDIIPHFYKVGLVRARKKKTLTPVADATSFLFVKFHLEVLVSMRAKRYYSQVLKMKATVWHKNPWLMDERIPIPNRTGSLSLRTFPVRIHVGSVNIFTW